MRVKITLVCSECQARNYSRTKARKTGVKEPLALNKYCPQCERHTVHKESK